MGVHINIEKILAETDKAFIVSLDDFEGEFVIPKSQVLDDTDDYAKGDEDCSMTITDWIADKLGVE